MEENILSGCKYTFTQQNDRDTNERDLETSTFKELVLISERKNIMSQTQMLGSLLKNMYDTNVIVIIVLHIHHEVSYVFMRTDPCSCTWSQIWSNSRVRSFASIVSFISNDVLIIYFPWTFDVKWQSQQ